jgi:hypothetical protein
MKSEDEWYPKWVVVSETLFCGIDVQDVGGHQTYETLSGELAQFLLPVFSEGKFPKLMEKAANDYGFALDESDGFSMPSTAPEYDFDQPPHPETGHYPVFQPMGSVVYTSIYHGLKNECFTIRLDHFLFILRVAGVFYAEHVDPEFNPWPYFKKFDQLLVKYAEYIPNDKAPYPVPFPIIYD